MTPKFDYTVIGVHEGGMENRYAEEFVAEDPQGAEAQALAAHPDLLIVAVIAGSDVLVVA
jgi:hypothetical protein